MLNALREIYVRKFICGRKGHAAHILEVHEFKDIIKCSRCNQIQNIFYRQWGG